MLTCIKDVNYPLFGNFFSPSNAMLIVNITKCTGHSYCKPLSEINSMLEGSGMIIVPKNSYVDFDDFDSPVKTYYDDKFMYNYETGRCWYIDLLLNKNLAEIDDRLIPIGNVQQEEFYSAEQSKLWTFPSDDWLFYSRISLSNQRSTYKRSVFSILDYFGKVGGIKEIMLIFGGMIAGLFTDKLMKYSILSELYQVDSTHLLQPEARHKQGMMNVFIIRLFCNSKYICFVLC